MSAEKPIRLIALLCLLAALALPAQAQPVTTIVDGRMTIQTPSGQAVMPLTTSQDWSAPLPQVTRAIIMVHGLTRAADQYAAHLRAAHRDAVLDPARLAPRDIPRPPEVATLLILPQFLVDTDIAAHGLGPEFLRWGHDTWPEGAPALAPAPLSSFDIIDAIFSRLADRTRFPALRQVVLAGHSAGGQLTQRYGIVGRGDAALSKAGIALRLVIANPSSWLWFGDDRPDPNPACPAFNHWRYGLENPPPYVTQPTENLEKRYLTHDAIYLLGDRDQDPNHPSLDRSCAAMTQGPHRFARGMRFMFNLELRQPNQVYHRLFIVRDVGHDPARMFASRCGLAALFDHPGCVGLP